MESAPGNQHVISFFFISRLESTNLPHVLLQIICKHSKLKFSNAVKMCRRFDAENKRPNFSKKKLPLKVVCLSRKVLVLKVGRKTNMCIVCVADLQSSGRFSHTLLNLESYFLRVTRF